MSSVSQVMKAELRRAMCSDFILQMQNAAENLDSCPNATQMVSNKSQPSGPWAFLPQCSDITWELCSSLLTSQ